MTAHRHVLDSTDKIVRQAFDVIDDFHVAETLHDFFPQNTQLHFCQSITHTSVQTKAERNVRAGIGAVNDQLIRIVENRFIMVT